MEGGEGVPVDERRLKFLHGIAMKVGDQFGAMYNLAVSLQQTRRYLKG